MASICSYFRSLIRNISVSRRTSPILFEIASIFITLTVLLVLDIIWITQEHKSKLDEMEKLHELDLLSFQKQFDVQNLFNLIPEIQRVTTDINITT